MTARSTSRSRASCCCPCGLAPVVAVAAVTSWGDATPCYASHMILVLLHGYGRMVCTGTKIKNFFIVVLIPKPFFKFPDKLIGKGCTTTGVLSMWNEIQRIASLHLAETLRPTALPHDSALHLSTSRASCCCPCGLAPVVTVAAGTSWGDAIPCYASHHMTLVLLYGLAHNTYPTLKTRQFHPH